MQWRLLLAGSKNGQVRHFVMTRHGLASKIRALGGINDRESEAAKDPHETYKPLVTSQERDYFNVNLILASLFDNLKIKKRLKSL